MTSIDIDYENPTTEDLAYIAVVQHRMIKSLSKLDSFTEKQFEEYFLSFMQWSTTDLTWGHTITDYANIAFDHRTPVFISEHMQKYLILARTLNLSFISDK